ncbi:TPA: VanW family protein [Yersinia enterocolitica]
MKGLEPVSSSIPLTMRFSWLYPFRVRQKQIFRFWRWYFGPERFSLQRSPELLPCKVYRHQSKLRRHLSSDLQDKLWQDNKIRNHELAIPFLNGIIIRPKETFSFWRLVGRPSNARGFVEGMQLSQGVAKGGIGGGLCQISNLLHWLALHSPLEISSRSSHSFDPFPDQGRVVPYGTGAALFYNYVDLWIFNPTDQSFQFRLWLTDTLLNGELRCEQRLPHKYRIIERNSSFVRLNSVWFRQNEIWREIISKGENREILCTQFLYSNHVRVMYEPLTISSPEDEIQKESESVILPKDR